MNTMKELPRFQKSQRDLSIEILEKLDRVKINTCDTCKWWGKERGSCMCPKLIEPIGLRDSEIPALCPPDCLLVEAYDNRGTFSTGPKFGCIHHEAA